MNHAKDTSLRDMLDLVRTLFYQSIHIAMWYWGYSRSAQGSFECIIFFSIWTFSHHLCSLFNHIVPSEYTGSSRKNEKSETVFMDTKFRADENRFTFLLSGWRWPCTAGRPWAEGLREWEREETKLQLWCKLNTTQIWYYIISWCKFKHLKQCHCLQIWYICISLKTYFEKKFWGKYNCQKRRVLNMYYSQYTLPYSAQIPREGKGEASTQYLYSLHWHLSIPAV